MKTPHTVKHRCVTTIKRKYWPNDEIMMDGTVLYQNLDNLIPSMDKLYNLMEEELPILSYYGDDQNWYLISTHRVISKIANVSKKVNITELEGIAENSLLDDIKGVRKEQTIISYELTNKEIIQFRTSTGLLCYSLIACLDDLIWMVDQEKIKYIS